MKATGLFPVRAAKSWLKLAGLCMLLAGMALTGLAVTGIPLPAWLAAQAKAADGSAVSKTILTDGVQTLRMHAGNNGYTPNVFFVQKNIPIRLVIQVDNLTAANNEILLPGLKLRKKLLPGENSWELPPQTTDISFSSWTGTLSGVIKVTDNLADLQTADCQKPLAAAPPVRNWPETTTTAATNRSYDRDLSKLPPDSLIHKARIEAGKQTIAIAATDPEPLVLVLEKNLPATLTFSATQDQQPQALWEIVDLMSRQAVASFTLPPGNTTIPFLSSSAGKFGIFRDKKMMKLLLVSDSLSAVQTAELHRMLLGNH